METGLKRLPLHTLHTQRGGRFGVFGEWEVPLYFSSILEEHEAVRTRAGLFDISHMGEFYLSGKESKAFLDYLLPRSALRLKDGKALYALLLNHEGKILDDLIVYQLNQEKFLFIVNAANIEKDFCWIEQSLPRGLHFENASERLFLFALQGPQSIQIAQLIFHCDFSSLGYYHFFSYKSSWGELLISRTGYTGEDGIEILGDVRQAGHVWEALCDVGKSYNLVPVGFGARDTLRLEAAMLLYGQDMDETTSPIEAGLDWAVDFDKKDFIGRKHLICEKQNGISRRLTGFELLERGIPRHDFPIEKQNKLLGRVTSGTFSPTLKKSIGLGYVTFEESKIGNEFYIVIREKQVKAKAVQIPFYKRPPTPSYIFPA